MLSRVLTAGSLCLATALSLHAGEPFEISLAESSADLSPYYRSVVHQATQLYRGDGPSSMITATVHRVQGPEIESEEIRHHLRGTVDFYLRRVSSDGGRTVISEAHFGPDAFSPALAELLITTRGVTRASNQTMELTAARSAFTLSDD